MLDVLKNKRLPTKVTLYERFWACMKYDYNGHFFMQNQRSRLNGPAERWWTTTFFGFLRGVNRANIPALRGVEDIEVVYGLDDSYTGVRLLGGWGIRDTDDTYHEAVDILGNIRADKGGYP